MTYQSIYRPGLFNGQTIIVTGGGSGIGRATAHELASLGAHVAIAGRTAEKLERVKAEIEEVGGSVSAHVCDIRLEEQVIATVEAVLALTGRIDGLFNNAGGQFFSLLKDLPTKGFEAVVRNNLTGGFIFMREVYNRWMKDNGGAIVNMSADTWMGLPNVGHTGAARAAMTSLTETAALEFAESGVRVNSVAMGMIESSGFDNYDGSAAERIADYSRHLPMQRFGTVSEAAAAIVFLLSPGASFITGTSLRIDGGGPNARRGWNLVKHDRAKPFHGFHLDYRPELTRDR